MGPNVTVAPGREAVTVSQCDNRIEKKRWYTTPETSFMSSIDLPQTFANVKQYCLLAPFIVVSNVSKPGFPRTSLGLPREIVKKNKYQLWNMAKNSKYPCKYFGNFLQQLVLEKINTNSETWRKIPNIPPNVSGFFPTVGITAVISVRYQLFLCFVSVFNSWGFYVI